MLQLVGLSNFHGFARVILGSNLNYLCATGSMCKICFHWFKLSMNALHIAPISARISVYIFCECCFIRSCGLTLVSQPHIRLICRGFFPGFRWHYSRIFNSVYSRNFRPSLPYLRGIFNVTNPSFFGVSLMLLLVPHFSLILVYMWLDSFQIVVV